MDSAEHAEMEAMLFSDRSPASRLVGHHLIAATRQRLGSSQTATSDLGWRILCDLVAGSDPIDERGHHPYLAARHLLGQVEYPTDPRQEVPYAKGLSWNELKRRYSNEFRSAPPRIPLTPSCRTVLAVLGGNYGTSRSLLLTKDHRPRLVARITEDFLAALDAKAAMVADDGLRTGNEHARPTRALDARDGLNARTKPSRLSRSTMISGITVLVLASFLAGVFWIGLRPPSSGIGVQRDVPSPGSSAYWEAGWGPDRKMFLVEDSPSYPVFNATKDGPIGDERNFVSLKMADDTRSGSWTEDLWVHPGDEVLVRIYVNNSGDSLGNVPAQSIQDASLKLGLTGRKDKHSVSAVLSAVNAQEVWDGATIRGDGTFAVEWESHSLKLESNAHPGPVGLALNLRDAVDGGVPLGGKKMNGVIAPGYGSAMYVTARLQIGA